jgi:hypothetical protein
MDAMEKVMKKLREKLRKRKLIFRKQLKSKEIARFWFNLKNWTRYANSEVKFERKMIKWEFKESYRQKKND